MLSRSQDSDCGLGAQLLEDSGPRVSTLQPARSEADGRGCSRAVLSPSRPRGASAEPRTLHPARARALRWRRAGVTATNAEPASLLPGRTPAARTLCPSLQRLGRSQAGDREWRLRPAGGTQADHALSLATPAPGALRAPDLRSPEGASTSPAQSVPARSGVGAFPVLPPPHGAARARREIWAEKNL